MPPTSGALQEHQELRRLYATLDEGEIWWRNHQEWLQQKGYMLRPRYRPGWKPSWEAKEDMLPYQQEDGIQLHRSPLIDAKRIADGKTVILKRVTTADNPTELKINRLFSTEPLVSHPRNRCAPIYETIDVPDEAGVSIMVMPLLQKFNNPSFKTVGEVVACFHQVFEALQFMHQCHVAHRDCMDLNIMMDTVMFPRLFHPQVPEFSADRRTFAKSYSRTWRPPRYFLIDFGLSDIFDPAQGRTTAVPILSGDRTVPEFQNNMDRRHEVYPTDIYYIGNMIRESFLQKYRGVEFIEPLVKDMVQDDPTKRPTIDEVIRRFSDIRKTLSWRKLRSRVVQKDTRRGGEGGFFTAVGHALRTICYVITFRPAVPLP